jgi:flagellar protein FliS
MASYQEHALDGASPVELVVALYDGIIRFLYAALAAAERDDVTARRVAVKRALAIVIHLQARLRMDIGGRPAEVLSEFYASIFALILQASSGNSPQRFEAAIHCVRDIRDAWRQVSADPSTDLNLKQARSASSLPTSHSPAMLQTPAEIDSGSRWTA